MVTVPSAGRGPGYSCVSEQLVLSRAAVCSARREGPSLVGSSRPSLLPRRPICGHSGRHARFPTPDTCSGEPVGLHPAASPSWRWREVGHFCRSPAKWRTADLIKCRRSAIAPLISWADRPRPFVLWQVPGEPSRLADTRSPGRRVREDPVVDVQRTLTAPNCGRSFLWVPALASPSSLLGMT